MNAAQIDQLHKSFKENWGKNSVYAVKGVSLTIPEGSIYGLIGPNGSGKSTIMKSLLGLLSPDAGTCKVFGQPARAAGNRQKVGFLPENPYFYKFLTGIETLNFYARLCGLHGKARRERCKELLQLVGLEDAAKRRVGTYSKGMLQRIGLAQALIQKPQLIILDEPTAGVDPIGSRVIRDIILRLKQEGMTIFLCSHLLEQVQEICDRVGILYQGCLIAEGTIDELIQDKNRQEITLNNAPPQLLEEIKQLAGEYWISTQSAKNKLENVFIAGIQNQLANNQ